MPQPSQSEHELTLRTNTGEAVSVRDIPISIIQAIYHEVTGRTEALRYNTDKSFLMTLNDLQQLYHKLEQVLEQYDIVGRTYTIKVDYDDDRSTTFSGWDKFKEQVDVTKREPILSVNVKLEFLISLPKVREYYQGSKFHRYAIDMTFVSKSAIDLHEIFGLARKFHLMHSPSIMVKIEYVDYVVASVMLNTIKDWTSTLDNLPNKWHFPKLQNISYHFSYFFVRLGMLSAIFPCYLLFNESARYANDSLQHLMLWMVLSATVLILCQIVFKVLGEIVEYNVDRTQELSCISIT